MKIIKPKRVSHTRSHIVNSGSIPEIMALYCPVKELEWCENWLPSVVYSNSGLVEKDCVFVTEGHGEQTVWYVTEYDIDKGRVEMVHHTPGRTFVKLEIDVKPLTDKTCESTITYTMTSLGKDGDEDLGVFNKEFYTTMMDSWAKASNHFLATGELLKGLPNF
ncbi:hypothetical protein [Fulvitalea axinellae]